MQNDPFDTHVEPFRIFFPLGYALAILGLGLWILDYLEPTRSYPGKGHAVLMMQGFAFSFSLGIILTEFGKSFGNIRFPALIHQALLPVLLLGMAAAALAREIGLSQMFFFFAASGFSAFLALSFGLKKKPAHPDFIFTAGASLAMLLGSFAWLLGEAHYLSASSSRWGQLACFQVFFILFAFGTFHWETQDSARLRTSGKGLRTAINAMVVLLLFGAIAAEAYLPDWAPDHRSLIIRAVYAVKAGLLVWFIQARMGAYEPPSLGSARLALFLILFGLSLPVLFPTFVVGVSHFTYIAGFCWFVLARASTLVEVRRLPVARWRTVILYGSFLLTGGLLRAVADFSPGGRQLLLPLASGFVLLPIVLWAFLFFPHIGDSRRRTASQA